MKFCKDCKWCKVNDLGIEFAECHAPKNYKIKRFETCSQVSGEVIVRKSKELIYSYCSTQRMWGWFMNLGVNMCGRSGKWFEAA